MSAADTALSISVIMAPGPENRQEPVAPDKGQDEGNSGDGETAADANDDTVANGGSIDGGNSAGEGIAAGDKQVSELGWLILFKGTPR